MNLYRRIHCALQRSRSNRSTRYINLIGCSFAYLRGYLEAQFQPGMNWGNYGEWHVDHITPCAEFDLAVPAEQRACFHFTNLQPLWAEENMRKGSKQKGGKPNHSLHGIFAGAESHEG